jgi:Mg/Co/Ni transporter MgtE
LKKINIDPAFTAGPFLATVMDILGTSIFCILLYYFLG